jgi:glycerol kinase
VLNLTSKSLFLAIDQGGHASRVMVFDAEGDLAASAQRAIHTTHPAIHCVEQDAAEILASIRECLEEVVEQLGSRSKHIEAAGLATQRSNIVCWDKLSGTALSPILSWQDTRAWRWLEDLHVDREDVHKTTGLFPSAHYGASKLRWCLDHNDRVKQALADKRLYIGPMSSYLAAQLTEEKAFVADPVSASRTLLWHVHRKDWDEYLLKRFGIPLEALPTCVPTAHRYGNITIHGQQIPLNIVTGDQSAALFAYGQVQPETVYVNIGTGAFVSRPSGYALLYARRLLSSVIYSDSQDSHYVLEGTVNGAGSALEWLAGQEPVTQIWEQLPVWLNGVTKVPLFLNGISGLAAPYWVPDFESEFLDAGDTAAKYVGVIESIVFLITANVQETMKFASHPDQLQVTGGLAKLDGMLQRIADLTRLPIYRPSECESTARGTAYLAAGMPNHWPENKHGDWIEPNDNPLLDQRYLLWENAMLERMRTGKT